MKKFIASVVLVVMSIVGLAPSRADLAAPSAASTAPQAFDAGEVAGLQAAEIEAAGLEMTAGGADDDRDATIDFLFWTAMILLTVYGLHLMTSSDSI